MEDFIANDVLIPIRSHADEADGRLDLILNKGNIVLGFPRQVPVGADFRQRCVPAFECVLDRFDLVLIYQGGWEGGGMSAVGLVVGADLDFLKTIENIRLHHAKRIETIDATGIA